MNDDETPFVNRYGHKPILKGDLETLKIDDENIPATPIVMKKSKKERRKREFHMKRWQKLALIGVIVAVVGIPVAVGEFVRISYARSAESAKQEVRNLTDTTVLAQQKKTDLTSKDMLIVVDKLSVARDAMCEGGLFDNIATLYPRSKDALEGCLATRSNIATLVSAMSDMTSELAYAEQLAPLLASVSEQVEGNYAILASQQENWKTLLEKVKGLNPPTVLRPTHETLVAKIVVVSDQWTALVNASSAKDATAFKNAETGLTTGYEAVRGVADELSTVIATTQARLTTAYAPLK